VTNPTREAAGDPAAPNGMTRLGPVRHFRIRALGTAVLFALAWVVVALLFSTVDSFYAGATGVRRPPPERAAVGEVGACRRVGPMSDHGLGFWWECQVHIRVEDGREVQTVLRRSIVSPDDAGRPVELVEACYGAGNTDCAYGRPVGRGWGFAVTVWRLVFRFVNAFFIIAIGIYLMALLVGPRRYDAIADKLLRQRKAG
jgi:Family of unknown function (DUF6346)